MNLLSLIQKHHHFPKILKKLQVSLSLLQNHHFPKILKKSRMMSLSQLRNLLHSLKRSSPKKKTNSPKT